MNSNYQKKFFDNDVHQYKKTLLASPPAYVQDEIGILLQLIPQNVKRVIDFGCGTGRLSIPLLKKGIKVIGVDISDKSLLILKKNIEELIPSAKGNFSATTKIPKEKIQAIVGTDILHHVSLDVIIPKIFATLSPGGVAIFSEPNALNVLWYIFLGLFINWEAEKGVVNCSRFNLERIFLRSGFKRIHFHPYAILPPIFFNSIPLLQRINYSVAKLPIVNIFAYRYIIYAVK